MLSIGNNISNKSPMTERNKSEEKEEGNKSCVRRAFKNNLGFHICFFCGCFLFFNDIQKVKEIALHVLQWGVLRNITESKKHIFSPSHE
jgi:hypothetical protein